MSKPLPVDPDNEAPEVDLCGQLSSRTVHVPSPCRHATSSWPNRHKGCGFLGSKSFTTATGYQNCSQLKAVVWGVLTLSAEQNNAR